MAVMMRFAYQSVPVHCKAPTALVLVQCIPFQSHRLALHATCLVAELVLPQLLVLLGNVHALVQYCFSISPLVMRIHNPGHVTVLSCENTSFQSCSCALPPEKSSSLALNRRVHGTIDTKGKYCLQTADLNRKVSVRFANRLLLPRVPLAAAEPSADTFVCTEPASWASP